jgi:twitching motility protein PilI
MRVIAIRHGEFFSGLLVGAVSGLQQVDASARTNQMPDVVPALQPFLDGAYRVGDVLWPVFDFTRLASHGGFIQAAA